MKLSFPLSLKVSLWLLLNLLLLAGAMLLFVQFGLGWESLASGPAADRVRAIGDVMVAELDQNPDMEPDTILTRFSKAYKINLFLFAGDGTQLAGPPIELPPEIKARVTLPPGGRGPPITWDRAPADGPPHPPPPRPDMESKGRMPLENSPRFQAHTNGPSQYWIGQRLLLPAPDGPRMHPTTLLAMTPSITGSGLFFDFKPWLLGAAVVAVVSILFWLPVVGSLTRTLKRLTTATEHIAEGRFDTRVAIKRRDEIGRLGDAIDSMAARLDHLVTGQRRFLGDIAHELGSPLGRLQFATSILEERAGPKLKASVDDVREEVQQMSELVGELLAFTKASLNPRETRLEPVELAPLVARVLAREAAGMTLAVEIPAGLRLQAEPALLARALGNLVRNAVRYAADAGPITVRATRDGGGGDAVLTVSDEGPGVPPEALARLGEPFYRPETARTRETGGVGLGLAIVKSSVTACRGTVRFSNRAPRGFVAELRIPVAAQA
jgi:two-component system sensor histidine kinase CpxA